MKTVSVRIAVAVDHRGHWNSAGSDVFTDKEAMGYACEHVEEGEVRYFVTAELPVPSPPEIPGTIEKDESSRSEVGR